MRGVFSAAKLQCKARSSVGCTTIMDFTLRLPADLLQVIFSYFQGDDDLGLVLPLRMVNRHWRESLTKVAWKISIQKSHSFSRKRLQWFTIFPRVNIIQSDCLLPHNGKAIEPVSQFLRSLTVTFPRLMDSYSTILTNLISLEFRDVVPSTFAHGNFYHHISSLRFLRGLILDVKRLLHN